METEVTVYGPLRSATGAKTMTLEWSGGTVADAIAAVVDAYPRAEPHLYDGDDVRPSVRASLDGGRAGLADRVPDGASLSIVPAVQGGAEEGTGETDDRGPGARASG
ncbi:MoaD/ThiS family protein [Natrinema salaciae]|uniref:Molybdopterin converting factor, small subunit n=1 Tax=Natrinema salaciae TaxID=1186196 RepID=A0A1H9RJ24_9EURY|nr:MoaD/ThiS family protein [Natrinema salaciae]SER72742.1 Molybdopterin converting factor, small subunit [Natrinema salaciae]